MDLFHVGLQGEGVAITERDVDEAVVNKSRKCIHGSGF
jgi:hypothetical protein